MTDTELEALQVQEQELWAQLSKRREETDRINEQLIESVRKISRETMRRELSQQMAAERGGNA
jgi:hypothetical protein